MLQTISDWILLIASIIGAITVIINFITKITGRTDGFMKRWLDKNFKKRLKEFLPEALTTEEARVKNDIKAYHNEDQEKMYDEIMNRLTPILNEIKTLNLEQNRKIEILYSSSKDVLREKIMGIYHKNKSQCSMTIYEREALDQYYKDYKAEDGNSYIDKYYARMRTWATINIDECNCEESKI